MKRRIDNKVWLFSFSDLAFLLLLAFTQASTLGKHVKIGEIDLPVVSKDTKIADLKYSSKKISYQIHVNKPDEEPDKPFQLVRVEGDTLFKGPKMSENDVFLELVKLKKVGIQRPILIPDRFSLSKDTVKGISIIQKIWQNSNKIVVKQS